jgi:hypothetical protein
MPHTKRIACPSTAKLERSPRNITDKHHTHMTATKWSSLSEFVKYLGREGICLVKEDEQDGLCIAWRDTSLQAKKRRQEQQQAGKQLYSRPLCGSPTREDGAAS